VTFFGDTAKNSRFADEIGERHWENEFYSDGAVQAVTLGYLIC